MTMVVNKIEYHQIRKYLLFVVLAGLIYSVYSIVVVYYDNKAIKAGPIKSYEIVSSPSLTPTSPNCCCHRTFLIFLMGSVSYKFYSF